MFTRRKFIGASAGVTAGCATPASDLRLTEILERHTRARGGARALDRVRNTVNIGEIVEPSFTVTGRYVASVAGMMRVDVFAGGERVFSEGIDEQGAWNWPAGAAASAASAIGAAALRHGIEFNLFGLHAYRRRGHALTFDGRETIDGVDYYKLGIRLADGFATSRYIHPATWLIERARDVRALHPDVDPTETTINSIYSDFRYVDGVVTSFQWRQINLTKGEEMQTGVLQRLEYNVGAEALNFPRSAPIIAP